MNLRTVSTLEPSVLWQEFARISDIPRGSHNEAAVIAYIKGRAEQNGLAVRTDHVGNLLVMLPATPGYEQMPGMVLQGHVDMVCEKNQGTNHDFTKDPIRLVIDGDWLRADETTLGADNGIAVAMMMALMETRYPHGPLDLLFTIDEEIGLIGAMALDQEMVRFRTLLNIDGEEDGTFYIGCAGGKETEGQLALQSTDADTASVFRTLEIGGLRGGHSGADINLQPANAIKLLGRFLWMQSASLGLQVAEFHGGDKHNAIPREAFALIAINTSRLQELQHMVSEWQALLRDEFHPDESGLFFRVSENIPGQRQVLTAACQSGLLKLVMTMPHGILSMSRTMPGLVSTSTNLAAIRTQDGKAILLTSQRSDVQTMLEYAAQQVRACLEANGASYRFVREYPAWTPRPDSLILKRLVQVYQNCYPEKEIAVGAIHAGLECGVIGSKHPGMDMVSFGPDIKLAHTPQEKLHIASAVRIWNFLLAVLADR